MRNRIKTSAGRIPVLLLALVTAIAASLLGAPPDLELDQANHLIKVEYTPKPASKQIQIKLRMQEGTSAKDLESRKVEVVPGRDVTETFRITSFKNCAYIVEVDEGGEKSRQVKSLYDPKDRPPAKKNQISRLLGVPLEQVGKFLEKVTSSILLNPEGRNIFRIDLGKKIVTKLTILNEGSVSTPMASPDGSRVAFVWNRADRQEVCVLNLDDVPVKPEKIRVFGQGISPVWWPEGMKLLYLRQGRIQAKDLGEGVEHELFPGGIDYLTRLLGWTRDGRLLAIVRLGTFDQLWAIDVPAGTFRLLDYDEAYLLLPRISPDRKFVVHTRYPGAGERTSLYLRGGDNTLTRLTNTIGPPEPQYDDDSPSWAPDSKSIIFVSNRP